MPLFKLTKKIENNNYNFFSLELPTVPGTVLNKYWVASLSKKQPCALDDVGFQHKLI